MSKHKLLGQLIMKKLLSVLIATALVSISTQLPSQAGEDKKIYVGAGATFLGDTTGFGIVSKVGISDNISIRPFISFLGSSGDTSTYLLGASATYDFGVPGSNLLPYGGIGYAAFSVSDGTTAVNSEPSLYGEAGADFNVADSFTINGNYRYYTGSRDGSFSLGAAYKF
jgi:outer membrane protein W